jgi:hypothetical protein
MFVLFRRLQDHQTHIVAPHFHGNITPRRAAAAKISSAEHIKLCKSNRSRISYCVFGEKYILINCVTTHIKETKQFHIQSTSPPEDTWGEKKDLNTQL